MNKLLEMIRGLQRSDGGFDGWCGPAAKAFTPHRRQPTIFSTILILDCLQSVPDAGDICHQAAAYLKGQVGDHGAWNYWQQGTLQRQTEPYPDDLDDTALAFAAVSRQDKRWADGRRAGEFARLLVSAEQAPGGPYNTWLINTTQSPQWQDVDIAVNANIAYALAQQDVRLEALDAYLEQAILAGDPRSKYYEGDMAAWYFLSRAATQPTVPVLRERLTAVATSLPYGCLQVALYVSAALTAGVDRALLLPAVERLHKAVAQNRLPAEPFYVDPVYEGTQYFGGSSAITVAFVLQALSAYDRQQSAEIVCTRSQNLGLMPMVRKDAKLLGGTELKRDYVAAARSIVAAPHGPLVTAAASSVAISNRWQLVPADVRKLNLASLNGWIAYTAYDDILDGSDDLTKICQGNFAARLSQMNFLDIFDSYAQGRQLVHATFTAMDCANDWELRQTRRQVSNDSLRISRLPDYDNYRQLAARSSGHSLAALGVLCLHFGALDHPAITILKQFFVGYLIARQLNDDAHDWESDLTAGQLSAAVTLLLEDYGPLPHRIHVVNDLPALQQCFWRHTIDRLVALIREQLLLAREDLDALAKYMDITVFEAWLAELEQSTAQAITKRDEALDFMVGFGITDV